MPRSGSYGKALAEQHTPGNVHSMQLEHINIDVPASHARTRDKIIAPRDGPPPTSLRPTPIPLAPTPRMARPRLNKLSSVPRTTNNKTVGWRSPRFSAAFAPKRRCLKSPENLVGDP